MELIAASTPPVALTKAAAALMLDRSNSVAAAVALTAFFVPGFRPLLDLRFLAPAVPRRACETIAA